MKQKRVRKPKDFVIDGTKVLLEGGYYQSIKNGLAVSIDEVLLACYKVKTLDSKYCRKLAAWLISAADYLEQEKQKRRG